MANRNDLEQQVEQLRRQNERLTAALEASGILAPQAPAGEDVTQRADYIEHGSAAHAALLGLVEVADPASHEGATFTGPQSGIVWALADEYEPVRMYPGMDPDKSVRLVLRQKVGELEQGRPPVPENAPPLWRPDL